MFTFISAETGSVYAVVPETEEFIYTPLYEDCTYDSCMDNWNEVDLDTIDRGYVAYVKKIRGELRNVTRGV